MVEIARNTHTLFTKNGRGEKRDVIRRYITLICLKNFFCE